VPQVVQASTLTRRLPGQYANGRRAPELRPTRRREQQIMRRPTDFLVRQTIRDLMQVSVHTPAELLDLAERAAAL
jgi:hypothetical protein